MQQQNSRDDGLGDAFCGGPAHMVSIKKNAKTIRHAQEYIPIARDLYGPLRQKSLSATRHIDVFHRV